MKTIHRRMLFAGAALLAATTTAHATVIDGTISPGEYSNATITNTPYNPASDVTLATFSNGNENVAETTYFQVDPNGQGFDFAVQTDPAGLGHDNADASVGDQFTNVYFGNSTEGAVVVFELGNDRAFNLATGAEYSYGSSLGIQYADTQGTTYANGGFASTSEAYIPFTAFNTVLSNLDLTTVPVGGTIQVRDLQAFSYGGNNAGGGERFGSVEVPAVSAAPEPLTWAFLVAGVGLVGTTLRRARFMRDRRIVIA